MKNRVFNDKKKLNSMLVMRKKGYSLISLGIIYGADFTTIYHHCKSNKIKKNKSELQFSIPNILSLVEMKIRKSKSYMEYLIEEQKRIERMYPNSTYRVYRE